MLGPGLRATAGLIPGHWSLSLQEEQKVQRKHCRLMSLLGIAGYVWLSRSPVYSDSSLLPGRPWLDSFPGMSVWPPLLPGKKSRKLWSVIVFATCMVLGSIPCESGCEYIFRNGLWQPRCGLGSLGCRNDFPDGLRSPSLAKVIVWNRHRKPLTVQCAPRNYFNEAGELRV